MSNIPNVARAAAGVVVVGALFVLPWATTPTSTTTSTPSGPAAPTIPAAAPGPAGPALTLPAGLPQLVDVARTVRARHGVPVSVTIAQALHESGNGRSQLARRYNNLYGIKCGGQSQRFTIATGCATLRTEECLPACGATRAPFRVYRSWQDSVLEYGRILGTLPSYRPAFAHRDDPERFVRAVAAGGYATDPVYAAKVLAVISTNNLRRYDR